MKCIVTKDWAEEEKGKCKYDFMGNTCIYPFYP